MPCLCFRFGGDTRFEYALVLFCAKGAWRREQRQWTADQHPVGRTAPGEYNPCVFLIYSNFIVENFNMTVQLRRAAVLGIFFSESLLWYFMDIFDAVAKVYPFLFFTFWGVVLLLTVFKGNDEKIMKNVFVAIMLYCFFMFFVFANSISPYYKMNSTAPVYNIFYFKREASVVFGSKGMLAAFVNCLYLIAIYKVYMHGKVHK